MEQDELLRYTADVLERLGVRYVLVGSFASGIWGEARFTQDIDIVVELTATHVRRALRDANKIKVAPPWRSCREFSHERRLDA